MPISEAWCGLVMVTGWPSKNSSPASTARLPVSALTIVDLPAPLSPMRATTSPASMSKDRVVEGPDVPEASRQAARLKKWCHALSPFRSGSEGRGEQAPASAGRVLSVAAAGRGPRGVGNAVGGVRRCCRRARTCAGTRGAGRDGAAVRPGSATVGPAAGVEAGAASARPAARAPSSGGAESGSGRDLDRRRGRGRGCRRASAARPGRWCRRRRGAGGRPARPARGRGRGRRGRRRRRLPERRAADASRPWCGSRPVQAPRMAGSRYGVRSPLRCGRKYGSSARGAVAAAAYSSGQLGAEGPADPAEGEPAVEDGAHRVPAGVGRRPVQVGDRARPGNAVRQRRRPA